MQGVYLYRDVEQRVKVMGHSEAVHRYQPCKFTALISQLRLCTTTCRRFRILSLVIVNTPQTSKVAHISSHGSPAQIFGQAEDLASMCSTFRQLELRGRFLMLPYHRWTLQKGLEKRTNQGSSVWPELSPLKVLHQTVQLRPHAGK